MSLDLLAVFFGGAVALLPIFAADILNVGASGLGWLRAAPAIGAGLMSVWLAHHAVTKHGGVVLLASVALFGVGDDRVRSRHGRVALVPDARSSPASSTR